MRSVVRKPGPALAPFVRFFGYFEVDGPSVRERVLPTGGQQLFVNLHEDELRTYGGAAHQTVHRIGGAAVRGVQLGPSLTDTGQQRSIALVCFRPGGAFPFFAVPPSELAGQLIEVAELWGRSGAVLRERMLAEPTPERKLRVLEAALLANAARPLEPDPAIGFAAAALGRSASVAHVAEQSASTPKRFIRRFREQTGLAPKRFARVRRFQRALASIPHDRPVDWAAIAETCGYFDQAHFINDFRAFAGITPTRYRPRSRDERNHVRL